VVADFLGDQSRRIRVGACKEVGGKNVGSNLLGASKQFLR